MTRENDPLSRLWQLLVMLSTIGTVLARLAGFMRLQCNKRVLSLSSASLN